MKRNPTKQALFYVGLLFISLILLFPFLWMLASSFKTQVDIISWPPKFIWKPTLANYERVFGEQNFLQYFLNSTIVGVSAIVGALLFGLPAAYSIARFTQKKLSVSLRQPRYPSFSPGTTSCSPRYSACKRPRPCR